MTAGAPQTSVRSAGLACLVTRGIPRWGPQTEALHRVLRGRGFDVATGARADAAAHRPRLAAMAGGFEIRPLVEDQATGGRVHPDVAATLGALFAAGVPIAAPCMALAVACSAIPEILEGEIMIEGDLTVWPTARLVTTSRGLFGAAPAAIEAMLAAVVDRAMAFADG